MEVLVQWFSHHLAQFISPEGAVFIISMIPILELRGGLLAASLLKISAAKALPICIVGNIFSPFNDDIPEGLPQLFYDLQPLFEPLGNILHRYVSPAVL